MRRRASVSLALILMLLGCSSGGEGGTAQQTSPRDSSATEPSAPDASKPAKLLKTGFGQVDAYAWVTSLVQNRSADNIGRFVTVQFNLYDKSGHLIASTEQVESFTRVDQKMAVGTQVDLPKRKKIAKVEATLDLSDYDDGHSDPSPEIKTGNVKIVKDEYGGTNARFEAYNPTKRSLKMVRIGVICFDPKGRVIGGGVDFPDLIPPAGKVLSNTSLMTSGKIDHCDAYAGPGDS